MILLKELKLNNFLSHEKTEIVFGENEKLLIDGKSGCGKSSIAEGILWVLYGRGRSDNRSLIRRGAKVATVSLQLHKGSSVFVITRTVNSAGKNTLVVTKNSGTSGQFLPIERTGLKDTQDWIENEFLRASYELFTNSVAYPQEKKTSFTEASASERKDLLLEIVRAGNFDELYEKTKVAIAIRDQDIAVFASNIKHLEESNENSKALAGRSDKFKEEKDRVEESLALQRTREEAIRRDLSNVSSLFGQIEEKKKLKGILETAISTLEAQIEREKVLIEEHDKIDVNALKESIKEALRRDSEISTVEARLRDHMIAQERINAHLSNKPQMGNHQKDIELLNQRLIPLIKDTGKCPAGDECPFVIPIRGQIDFLSEQITEKTKKIEEEKRAMDLWEREYSILVPVGNTESIYAKLADLKLARKDVEKLKFSLEQYEQFIAVKPEVEAKIKKMAEDRATRELQLDETRKKIEELKILASPEEFARLNKELSTVQMVTRGLQKQLEQATADLAVSLKAQEDILKATQEAAKLKKDIKRLEEERDSLVLLKEALSPRGVKAVIIDYLVPNLEERINGVLSRMSDFRIRLDTQKATADDEGVKEGLFITVINDLKEELPFSSYSGGEKVKITVAISEALASLMTQVGFRIMDENIVSLDSESTEGFVEVLTGLQEKFPQLLVISHLQEVKDIFEKQIKIIKTNGISKIYE